MAVRGLESVWRNTEGRDSVREEALLMWVELEAEANTLKIERLVGMGEEEGTIAAAVSQLAKFGDNPQAIEEAAQSGFWFASDLRRHVLAMALKAFGSGREGFAKATHAPLASSFSRQRCTKSAA